MSFQFSVFSFKKVLSAWRAWPAFLGCVPEVEVLEGAGWEEADKAALEAFLKTGTGQRMQAVLRIHVRRLEAQACHKVTCADFERGRASGVRTALSFIQQISVPSAPQPTEESEFVLPGAQDSLATRWTP
jgi:hypothetical protein